MPTLLPEGVSDPYALLIVDVNANDKALKTAYRKRALKLHPDKNPDDANARHKFDLLQRAYEFLLDAKKRAEYDSIVKARELRDARFRQQTEEKQMFAEKLSSRENGNEEEVDASLVEKRQMEAKLKALRKQNDDLVKKRRQDVSKSQQQIFQEAAKKARTCSEEATVRIGWRTGASVSERLLSTAFMHYNFVALSLFDDAECVATATFRTREDALEACLHVSRNKKKFPFRVKMADSPAPQAASHAASHAVPSGASDTSCSSSTPLGPFCPRYESDTLSRLRQMAAQQRLSRTESETLPKDESETLSETEAKTSSETKPHTAESATLPNAESRTL